MVFIVFTALYSASAYEKNIEYDKEISGTVVDDVIEVYSQDNFDKIVDFEEILVDEDFDELSSEEVELEDAETDQEEEVTDLEESGVYEVSEIVTGLDLSIAPSNVLVGWNFQNENKRNTGLPYEADFNNSLGDAAISLWCDPCNVSSWLQGQDGVSTSAANRNNWNMEFENDIEVDKFWKISFSTLGFESLSLSSAQLSSNTGPKNFMIQWSLDQDTWNDVENGNVMVSNNFTNGAVKKLPLPSELNNQEEVFIRWIRQGSVSVSDGTIASAGTSRIDGIFVYAENTIFHDSDRLIAQWDFNSEEERLKNLNSPYVADYGNSRNKGIAEFQVVGGNPTFVNWLLNLPFGSVFAPNFQNWHSIAEDQYWLTTVNTQGMTDLKLFSRQRSSINGPRDFRLEYSLDNQNWYSTNYTTLILNSEWQSNGGVLSNVALPSELNDQEIVYLRWLNTSTTAVNGSGVLGTGTSSIAEITLTGLPIIYELNYESDVNGVLEVEDNTVSSFTENVEWGANSSLINAVADNGFRFSQWSDGITDNPRRDVDVISNISVVAEFEKIDTEKVSRIISSGSIPKKDTEFRGSISDINFNWDLLRKDSYNKCDILEILSNVLAWDVDGLWETSFNDIPLYCIPYAAFAQKNEIVYGISLNELGVESTMNRYELFVITFRALKNVNYNFQQPRFLNFYEELVPWSILPVNTILFYWGWPNYLGVQFNGFESVKTVDIKWILNNIFDFS